jgi:putative salt-induced outer membrane protein YdiY
MLFQTTSLDLTPTRQFNCYDDDGGNVGKPYGHYSTAVRYNSKSGNTGNHNTCKDSSHNTLDNRNSCTGNQIRFLLRPHPLRLKPERQLVSPQVG